VKTPFVAREDPDLGSVWHWFEFQLKILSEARTYINLRAKPPGTGRPLRGYEAQFFEWTSEEIKAFFEGQQGELERLTMFELLATVEATLRLDFEERVENKWKDPVSRRFRNIAKARSGVRLDEDILETWKNEREVNVSDFRAALKLRHWLAHGRHWHPKLGQGYDPASVYQIATVLLASLHF
jgi:hypothetical protein